MAGLFCWNVLPRDVWGVWLAIRWEAFGDTSHEQLNSPTTHFWSLTSTASQHFPNEALIMSAVHQRGIGSSGSSRVFIITGQSCSTNFLRSASRSILISFFV